MSITPGGAKWTAVMFGLGAAACVAGSLAHSTPATVLGCIMGGISCLWWLAGLT